MLTSNTFRRHKLSKSMDLKSESFSQDSTHIQTPKISAMNSVAKSVKYNNLRYVTGQQLCKLRREPEEGLDNPQYLVAHGNMAQIRKKYDKISQQKFYHENKIQRLQQELKKYKMIEDQLQNNKGKGSQNVSNQLKSLEEKKLFLEEKEFQKKSMQQMIKVINHDKVLYDKRKYDMEVYLNKANIYFKAVQESLFSKNQEDDRVLKVHAKLMERLNAEEAQRQQHINSMETRIFEKQGVHNSSILRSSQMGQIAEQAMTDRDEKQKEWLRVFRTHKLLQKMLKCKIQRQMEKFNTVENSFKNIKIQTGVSDAKVMVEKFLNKEQVYGDLLSKITQNQKQIQSLKKVEEEYRKSIKQSQQQINFLDVSKTSHGDFVHEMKMAENIEEKRKNCDVKEQVLRTFLNKSFKILIKNGKLSEQQTISDMRSKETIKQQFLKHLNTVSSLLQQAQKKFQQSKDSLTQQSTLFQEQNSPRSPDIVRIKPQVKHTKYDQSEGKMQIEQYREDYQEEQLPSGQSHEQTNAIEQQRYNLVKSNEKFMRDLKFRKWQQKQILVEAMVKNTKQKPVAIPAKKVQVVQD